MNPTLRRAAAATLLLGLLTLPGCANTPLSGAGQMRIDVAVYKGPLSKEPDVQWGELIGVVQEAGRGLKVLEETAHEYARLTFSPVNKCYTRTIGTLAERTVTPEARRIEPTEKQYIDGRIAQVRREVVMLEETVNTRVDQVAVGASEIDSRTRANTGDIATTNERIDEVDRKIESLAKTVSDRMIIEPSLYRSAKAPPPAADTNDGPWSCGDTVPTTRNDAKFMELGWCNPPEWQADPDAPALDWSDFFRSATDRLHYFKARLQYAGALAKWKRTLARCYRILEVYADANDARQLVQGLDRKNSTWDKDYKQVMQTIQELPTKVYLRTLAERHGLTAPETKKLEEDCEASSEKCRKQATPLVQLETDGLALRMRDTIKEISRVSYRLKQKAVTWAGHHLKNAEPDFRTRQIQTAFSIIAAEYSNQMSSKADALLKQMQPNGNDRQELPLSVHLRDASSTGFTSLAQRQHTIGAPLDEESGATDYALNRLRVFEQLYDDDSWSRINTVHAVGRGEVRMAFIKDEIGNWNLKRFDNDPTELLDAYKDVGLAALKAATTAVGGAGGVGGAQQLLGLANQVALGGAPASAPALGNKTVVQLHQGVVDRLNRLKADMTAKRGTLTPEIDALEKTVKTRQEAVTETKAAVEAKQGQTEGNTAAGRQAEASAQTRLAELLRAEAAEVTDETRKAGLEKQAADADTAAKAAETDVGKLTKLEAEIAALKETLAERETDATKAVAKRDAKKAELDTLAKSTAEQAALILERHGLIVDELESATVSEASPAAGASAGSAASLIGSAVPRP